MRRRGARGRARRRRATRRKRRARRFIMGFFPRRDKVRIRTGSVFYPPPCHQVKSLFASVAWAKRTRPGSRVNLGRMRDEPGADARSTRGGCEKGQGPAQFPSHPLHRGTRRAARPDGRRPRRPAPPPGPRGRGPSKRAPLPRALIRPRPKATPGRPRFWHGLAHGVARVAQGPLVHSFCWQPFRRGTRANS